MKEEASTTGRHLRLWEQECEVVIQKSSTVVDDFRELAIEIETEGRRQKENGTWKLFFRSSTVSRINTLNNWTQIFDGFITDTPELQLVPSSSMYWINYEGLAKFRTGAWRRWRVNSHRYKHPTKLRSHIYNCHGKCLKARSAPFVITESSTNTLYLSFRKLWISFRIRRSSRRIPYKNKQKYKDVFLFFQTLITREKLHN